MDKNERLSVFLMVTLLAFAVVLVDDRLLRTALAVLPALMLAQKAMGSEAPPQAPTGAATRPPATVPDERRKDEEVRSYIEQLLRYFREFYTTCHLMSMNVLTVEAAEERANNLERDLNQLLAKVTETARTRAAARRV